MNKTLENKKVVIKSVCLIFLFSYFFYILLSSYWYQISTSAYSIVDYEYVLFPWIVISLLFNVIGFKTIFKVSFSDAALWYIHVSFLFMFGHIFLKVFNLETSLLWNPSIYFLEEEKFKGAQYALLSLNCISLGYFLYTAIGSSDSLMNNYRVTKSSNRLMFNTGLIVFLIGFIFTVLSSYIVVTSTYRAGSYVAYAEIAGSTGFLDDFSYLTIPGVIYILCSKKLNINIAKLFTIFICIFYIVVMVFSGSRKSQLFSILTIFLCYNFQYSRFKLKISSSAITTILSFLFLNLIYIIREYRINLSLILPKFFESIVTLEFIKKIFGETFAETGLTMYSVVAILKYVPETFQYEYGLTFVRSLLSILPLGSLLPQFFNKGYSTFVINKYTGIPVGSSLIGDFYWNFGLIGALMFSFLFGLLLGKIGKMKYRFDSQNPNYFLFLFIIFLCIRAGIMDIMRPMIIITVIPILINKFVVIKRL